MRLRWCLKSGIVFIMTPFLFLFISMLKQRTAFSSNKIKNISHVHSAAHGLHLFTVNMRLLTSSQVTVVSKEVPKGQQEKGRVSGHWQMFSWWKIWAVKDDKEASWRLVWLLVWYSRLCVKWNTPHF